MNGEDTVRGQGSRRDLDQQSKVSEQYVEWRGCGRGTEILVGSPKEPTAEG